VYKILVIGPSWIGDMVMAQSLFIQLHQNNRNCVIDVLAPAWSGPILEWMPQVRKAINMPVGHGRLDLKLRYQLGKDLREEAYDQAIVLPNSFKSALIPLWARIPLRTGWRGEMRYGLLNDIRKLDKAAYPLMVQRFVALAFPAGESLPDPVPIPHLVINHDQQPALVSGLGLDAGKPALALCPGAEFGVAKQWPAEHYSSVAKQ
jgi:heptosyltransferase-2